MKKFETPELPYAYDALEPYIDKETMEIHHDKHHVAYTTNFNKALGSNPELYEKSAEEILQNLNDLPEEIRMAVKNHGGGHVHHNFFWEIMMPNDDSKLPSGELVKALEEKFGSFEKFKEEFTSAAMTVFGSGWAWLALKDGELEIVKTSKQDSPWTDGYTPILGIDVWEHSYYLKYQNRRAEFVEAFWSVVNWPKVSELYENNK